MCSQTLAHKLGKYREKLEDMTLMYTYDSTTSSGRLNYSRYM